VSEKKVFQKSYILSHRKHGKYIAVNCGAIPEGTIDSELLGMRKALLQERQEPVKVILK
jgi:transcriptional regulator with PAS, ATPase and Fis domain